MTRKVVDVAASVMARLKKLARDRREDLNLVIMRYANERLLYRLSRSEHKGLFVLKGATLFSLWTGEPHRPTKDVDLLAQGDPDASRLKRIFAAICSVPVEADGLVFGIEKIVAEAIREEAVYDGIRVRLPVSLGKARTVLQVDVGFGDATSPEPQERELPTLLEMPAPVLATYQPETVVAEKLEAIVQLGMTNTRMKDYFDLRFLSEHFDFDGVRLAAAVRATFARRRTPLPPQLPVGLTEAFGADPDKRQQWQAFSRRLGSAAMPPPLTDVVKAVATFLAPVIVAAGSGPTPGTWKRGHGWSRKASAPSSPPAS